MLNRNPLPIATLIVLLIMLACFFAWRLSAALVNKPLMQQEGTDLLDGLIQ